MPRDVLELIIDAAKNQGPKNFRKFVCHASLACRHWLHVTNDHITELRTKAIWKTPLEQLLHRMTSVNSIKLSAARGDALEILVNYPRITALDLSEGCRLRCSSMAAISRCVHLCKLNLHGCHGITDAALKLLEANHNLLSLDIGECEELTGTTLFILQKMRNLLHLNLEQCINLKRENLQVVSEIGSLTALDMVGVCHVDDSILLSLRALHNLHILNLSDCRFISDTGVVGLTSLSHLQTLNLSYCMRVTDLSVDCLSHLPSLTELHLNLCDGITQVGAQYLSRLIGLKVLNIQSLPLTPDGLVGLSVLKSLEVLDIRGTHMLRRNISLLRRGLGESPVTILHP